MMRGLFKGIAVCLAASLLMCGCTSKKEQSDKYVQKNEKNDVSVQQMFKEDGVSYAFKTSDRYFEIYNGKKFEEFYSVGVNVGTGKPNYFPGDMGINENEYLKWFEQIADMNANTIRVYTVLGPEFYNAFYEYNTTHEKKLYLFQGCWYDEDILAQNNDAFGVLDSVKKDLKDLVDIFHGNAVIEERPGHAFGEYTKDISNYVIGWILGIESDQTLVESTNAAHADHTSYSGDYLFCENVQPYEAFWCEIGDYALAYEDGRYHMQRPVSFSNWPTADVMEHPNEPLEQEDAVSLNVEDLHTGKKFKAGLFASYHVYPYYPNFMFEEEPYKSYVDADGNRNTYRGYLEELLKIHHCPVLVAEFGVPASRGVTHINPITGYNQGGLNEKEQGEMLISMFEDIKDSGCAGALVFAWQDEWFKRTWNTMDYNNSNRRAFWNDIQTCEQHFGIMEFVSAENKPTPVIDGKRKEWSEKERLFEKDGTKVYAKTDSTYLYLMIDSKNADYGAAGNLVYFDIAPELGSDIYKGISLGCQADFVLEIGGKDATRLMVHEYSDLYHFVYRYEDPESVQAFTQSEDGFQPVYLITDRALYLPQTDQIVPVQRVETGLLRFGTSDTDSKEYDSLTDFCYDGDVFEARIAWNLLGFRDPSQKEINGNFLKTGSLDGIKIDNISIGMVTPAGNLGKEAYTWENWERAYTRTRLRQSYYMVQDYLSDEKNRTVAP